MKKNVFLSIISFLIFYSLNAQQWNFANNFSYGHQNVGRSIGTDNAQNIYVTGSSRYFTGGNGGASDNYAMLWKFNGSGNILWADTLEFGGSTVCDTNGNIYIGGGNKIAKYNSAGNQLWVVTGISNAYFVNIALHPLGGLVVVGKTISDTSKSIFFRYDQNGNLLWTKIGEFSHGGTNLKCDNLGNMYIVGSGPRDSVSGNNGFLVKYNDSGDLLYNMVIPATINAMAIDINNNIYVAGWFSLVPINILGNIYTANPNSPVPQFIIKYDPAGNVLWYKIINGILGTGGIAADNSGYIYLMNSYTTLIIDNLNLSAPYNATNLFVMKADSVGTVLWYKTSVADVSGAYASAGAICVSDNGEILVTGSMSKTNTFDSFALTQASGYSDLLIAKIGLGITTNVAPPKRVPLKEFNVFPNPGQGMFQISYTASEAEEIQINVFNNSGIKVYSEKITNPQKEFTKNINLSKEAKGTYYIELISDGKKNVRKVILN